MPASTRHRLSDGLVLWADPTDEAVSLPIIEDRYELNELELVSRTVHPGNHVVDLGAHVGAYTVRLASLVGPRGHVTALEPSIAHVEALAQSVAANLFEDRTTIVHAAASDARGEGWLRRPSPGSSSAHSRLASQGDVTSSAEVERVATIRVDDLSAIGPVSFIKVDVEGAEGLALRGATRVLATDRPIILAELHPRLMPLVGGDGPAALIAEMAALGYECRLLGAGVAGEPIEDTPTDNVTSVVFLPR